MTLGTERPRFGTEPITPDADPKIMALKIEYTRPCTWCGKIIRTEQLSRPIKCDECKKKRYTVDRLIKELLDMPATMEVAIHADRPGIFPLECVTPKRSEFNGEVAFVILDSSKE